MSPKPMDLELFSSEEFKEQKKAHDLWAVHSSAPDGAEKVMVSHPVGSRVGAHGGCCRTQAELSPRDHSNLCFCCE